MQSLPEGGHIRIAETTLKVTYCYTCHEDVFGSTETPGQQTPGRKCNFRSNKKTHSAPLFCTHA